MLWDAETTALIWTAYCPRMVPIVWVFVLSKPNTVLVCSLQLNWPSNIYYSLTSCLPLFYRNSPMAKYAYSWMDVGVAVALSLWISSDENIEWTISSPHQDGINNTEEGGEERMLFWVPGNATKSRTTMKWRRSNADIKLVMARLDLVVGQRCGRGQPGIHVNRTVGIGDAPVGHLGRRTQEEWECHVWRRN